jgi:hypothetical protein
MPQTFLSLSLFSLDEGAAIAGVSLISTRGYVRRGLLPLAVEAGPELRTRMLDAVGVICLCVVRDLRRRGLSRESIKPITDFVGAHTLWELHSEMLKRNTILVAGDKSPPELISSAAMMLLATVKNHNLIVVNLKSVNPFKS